MAADRDLGATLGRAKVTPLAGGECDMSRNRTSLTTLLALVMARAADVGTTFHFDPTLDNEANPAARLGAEGVTFLGLNVVLVIVTCILPLAYYWRGPSKTLQHASADPWQFASLCFYNRIMPRRRLLKAALLGWPLPRDWRQLLRLCGLVIPWAVIAGSCVATFSWWAIHEWEWTAYERFRAATRVGGYPSLSVAAALLASIVATIAFVRIEFAQAVGRSHRGKGSAQGKRTVAREGRSPESRNHPGPRSGS